MNLLTLFSLRKILRYVQKSKADVGNSVDTKYRYISNCFGLRLLFGL